ncbi:MAG: BlaI/MecI/CopY family transcriptional regulator [Caulobacteraceae bacterium]
MTKAARGNRPPPIMIPKHRTLEFRVLDVLWRTGPLTMQAIRDELPENHRPSYETVRSIIYRLQERGAIRRVKKVSKSQIFEAAISRQDVEAQLIDDLAGLFPNIWPVLDRLVSTQRLTLEDLREAERLLGLDQKRA